MFRAGLIVAVVAVLVAAGVYEGVLTNRWGDSEDVRAAASRLAGVPAAVGPWSSTEVPIEKKILDKAEAAGHVSRTYRSRVTGSEVSVLLLCGPSGPIGAHTPDICYAGLGYRMRGREEKRTLALPDGRTATYWAGRFEKPGAGEPPLEVYWAWGVDGDWAASDAPRAEFALGSSRYLYKLYVSRTVPPTDRGAKPGPDPVTEFLTAFLPEVRKALTPGPGGAGPEAAPQ